MSGEPITSLQNQRVKNAIKLRNPRERNRQQRFVIDGLREISHALNSDIELDEVFVCHDLSNSIAAERLLAQLEEQSTTVLPVTEKVWEKLTFGNRQDGILTIAKTPQRDLKALRITDHSLIVILESIEKPGNVGAVLRSADGAGATAVILANPVTDLYNPNTIRASLGTIFRLPLATCTTDEVLVWLRSHKLPTFVTTVGTNHSYTDVNLRASCAVVLGSEAHGVSAAWQADDLNPIGIPMLGQADSLNISASAAVVLYEAARQRR